MPRMLSKQWLDIVPAQWIGKPIQHYARRQKCLVLYRFRSIYVLLEGQPYITFLETEVAQALSVAHIIEAVREAVLSDRDMPIEHQKALHFMLRELT